VQAKVNGFAVCARGLEGYRRIEAIIPTKRINAIRES
jgi:hypothetical protein